MFEIIVAIIVGVVIIIIGWFIGSYKLMFTAKGVVDGEWIIVKRSYVDRVNIIYQLAGAIRLHDSLDPTIFHKLSDARNNSFGKGRVNEFKFCTELDEIFVKISTNQNLPADLVSQDMLCAEQLLKVKQEYNCLVYDYNLLVSSFPNTIISKGFNTLNVFNFDEGLPYGAVRFSI